MFIVKGGFGYDLRLASIDPNYEQGHLADLNQMLQTLTFHS